MNHTLLKAPAVLVTHSIAKPSLKTLQKTFPIAIQSLPLSIRSQQNNNETIRRTKELQGKWKSNRMDHLKTITSLATYSNGFQYSLYQSEGRRSDRKTVLFDYNVSFSFNWIITRLLDWFDCVPLFPLLFHALIPI